MNPDQASLDNLRDIVEQVPVSWWPLAAGWWVLGAVLLVVIALIVFWRVQQWRSNAYRRAALGELESAASVAEISEILKRTALAVFPRAEVASLSGAAWTDWLGQAVDGEVPVAVGESLAQGVFSKSESGTVDVSLFAANWIRQHKPCLTDPGPS